MLINNLVLLFVTLTHGPVENVVGKKALDQTLQTTYDILLVGFPTNMPDQVTKDTLEKWGYTVELIDALTYQNVDHSNYRLIYISESVDSPYTLHYRDSGYPIPAFFSEPYALDRMGLGRVNQEARNTNMVVEEMKIVADKHPITKGLWQSEEVVRVTDNSSTEWIDVFQFEFDPDDPTYNSGVLYNVLGTANIQNSSFQGFPTWAVIYGGYGPVPEGVNIVVHAFHEGSSLKGTPVYWLQVRKSIEYLLGE